jgi:opacity protein-like surface antigen
MKRITLAALLALGTTSLMAHETKFLPIVTDPGYHFSPAVAIVGGYGKYKKAGQGSAMYGIELDIACPLLELSSNDIKQQISIVHSSKTDTEKLSTTSIELNPHVQFDVTNKLQIGVGPGFGVVFADADGATDTVFGINIGASANYEIEKSVFVGIEGRYQWTTKADFGNNGNIALDNYRTLLKVGYKFQ